MIVDHIAKVQGWNINEEVFQNAQTLILGSFNPNKPVGNTDYYYGRGTNYFWKAIAEIYSLHVDHFLNNKTRKIEFMTRYKFCFLDVINSVEITSNDNNESILSEFINEKIYAEFSDQILFTTNTRFKNNGISLTRLYNDSILNRLDEGNIKTVIHTMGNNRIAKDFHATPQENSLHEHGFQGFINRIKNHRTDVNFVPLSFSPSRRAVNNGGSDYKINLKNWLHEHINS